MSKPLSTRRFDRPSHWRTSLTGLAFLTSTALILTTAQGRTGVPPVPGVRTFPPGSGVPPDPPPPTASPATTVNATVGTQQEDSAPGDRQHARPTLRVMTYNIHHGEGVDGRVDLERIAAVIKAQEPDVVALQEVDKGVARTDRIDTPAELARLTGMTALFHNNFSYQGGEYGNAILSRFPVLSETNTHLKMLRSDEQRGVLQAVVETPGGRPLLFAATHIDYRRDDAERLQNVQEFKELLSRNAGLPFILCGDFNDSPGSRVHTSMQEDFVDCWAKVGEGDGFTFSSERPRNRIDYVWVARRQPAPQPKRAWIPTTQASDHLPLLLELELP